MVDYQAACEQQESLLRKIILLKQANSQVDKYRQQPTPNYLLFCEHPPVYTLGKGSNSANLLTNETILQHKGIPLIHTNRGGDITYHGPGQIVVYPIIDLENFFMDIHRYLRLLEEGVIATLQNFGLASRRLIGYTGVWIGHQDNAQARKICAIGVRLRRWVTMHGLALNVNTDLRYFEHIRPCGIPNSQITSIKIELGLAVTMSTVIDKLQGHMIRLLAMEPVASWPMLAHGRD